MGRGAGRRAEGAASREQGAGRRGGPGGRASLTALGGSRSGTVAVPLLSPWSPYPGGGVLPPPRLESGCLISPPGGVGPGIAGGSLYGPSPEGSRDWVWGSGHGGQKAHARALPRSLHPPLQEPLPKPVPPVWVGVCLQALQLLLPCARFLPSQQSRFLFTFVFLFGHLPVSSASVSPVAHCVGVNVNEAALGLKLASLAAPNLKDFQRRSAFSYWYFLPHSLHLRLKCLWSCTLKVTPACSCRVS